ncbi:hypothetical protein BUALT_Bualt16G0065300 [Buddleja alternifolia]|uniref:BHLH domain-containing protein n=1 Tax=Buddleja alternifolia TaxID=168488 RepID=A0AAV6WKF3_9LAMI|nr:hypothetical protein BUALT_Bualt16G0065300 [Buddleja alternifolia]
MNQGVVQSSPAQQLVAAGSPGWWSMNNMRPPPNHQHHSFMAAPPQHHSPNHLTPPLSAWNDSLELPESWSQLLLGGLVGEEDKPADLSHIQAKKLENWEQQFLNQTSNSCGNVEFQGTTNCWSRPMLSPKSSCITSTMTNNMLDFSHKSSAHQDPSSKCNSISTGGAAKKARIQPSSAQSTFKVRKEKLGDRITSLHQLVSPFGKTDTASVLLEAIGYIRFLQSQVEALSLPYLGSASANMRSQHPVKGERNCLFPEDPGQLLNENCMKRKGMSDMVVSNEEPKKDLRSRGLCLVPLSCTLHVGSEINGADYWASAFGANFP